MKLIDYGHDTSNNPVGSFDGIGINEIPEGAITGEFLGIVRLNDKDFLIGRTTMAFKEDPKYIGKITARQAIVEKYPDGSGTIFIDIEENSETRAMEEVLSDKEKREGFILTEEKLRPIANKKYDSVVSGNELTATAIRHDIFQKKLMLEEKMENEAKAAGNNINNK